MDVNGTRFQLILGREEWMHLVVTNDPDGTGTSVRPDFDWDEERASLRLHQPSFRFPTPPGDRLPRPQDRRGAGRDRYGNWYWIHENNSEIRYLMSERRQAEHFWSAADMELAKPTDSGTTFRPVERPAPRMLRLRGLAVTSGHYLVVGILASADSAAGLLIFDLHAGGPPIQLDWPRAIPFTPFDLSAAADGGVWILDYNPDDPTDVPHYWRLNRLFQVIAVEGETVELAPERSDDFQPEAAAEDDSRRRRGQRIFPAGLSLDLASPLDGLQPLAIEALPDDSVLFLDASNAAGATKIYRYRGTRQLGFVELMLTLDLDVETDETTTFALRGHDIAFVADPYTHNGRVAGTLYVVDADGNQTFAFRFDDQDGDFTLALQPHYLPMRLYSGKALVAAGGDVYYDLQERWIKLVEQPRRRYRTTGVLESPMFDGKEPACVWHRLFLDACIPQGCAVEVESRAADNEALLSYMPWRPEPALYLRADGAEIPGYTPFTSDDPRRNGTGTWELLFQYAQGRYLQLRLTVRGTGRTTPYLRALRAYYPRFSYLKEYLPTVYQYDVTSAAFLDRFLANLEGMYTVLEQQIAQAQTLFDIRTTPAEYLDWLAGWFGVILEPGWDEARRRLFLDHAMEMFNQRGTPAGIVRAIRLATDPCPDERLFEQDVLGMGFSGSKPPEADTPFLRYSVRIVERFMLRNQPGVVYGDPTENVSPGLVASDAEWMPQQGAEPLHQRYRDYLRQQYKTIDDLNKAWESSYNSFEAILLSPILPAHPATAADWRGFTGQAIGFTYAEVDTKDTPDYQAFLARRYRRVALLAETYQLSSATAPATFADVQLPGENDMPAEGRQLYDWIQFVSLVLPIKRNAHRFTVLVPVDTTSNREIQARLLGMVQRITSLEKPAHTDFEVKQYWALFRIGEARLGLDTLLDVGSRYTALVLGSSYLAEGYVAPALPWSQNERIVTGRDQVRG